MTRLAKVNRTGEEAAAGSARHHRDSLKRRAAFLAAFVEGRSVADSCAAANVGMYTYFDWRKKDPDFRTRVDQVKQNRREATASPWSGDFVDFRKRYLHMDTYWHQHQIVHALNRAGPQQVVMVLCCPEMGKSTLMVDWICFKLALEPNHRILIVSESHARARKMVMRVARRMTDTAAFGDYIARFGPFRSSVEAENGGRPWTQNELTVLKATHDEADFSLESKGSTGQVAGQRVDTLIVDDIQSLRNLSKTESLVELFRQDFLSRIGTKGKVFIVGTRVSNDDFYSELLDIDGGDGTRLVSKHVTLPALDDDGAALCPELWPAEALARKRVMVGEDAWWRNYMQRPHLAGTATFSTDMIGAAKDRSRTAGEITGALRSKPVVIGLDPALGGGNALVALAYDSTSIDVLDCVVDYGLARTEDILARLEEFAYRYRPTTVVIEINAFQRSFARDDRMAALARRHGFVVREHTTNRNKADAVLGIGSMAGSFLRHEVSIPWRDTFAHDRMEPLVGELASWRPTVATRLLRQDLVVAMWFAWRHVMEARAVLNTDVAAWRRQGMPFTPTSYAALRSRVSA